MPELSINLGVEIRNAELETHHFKVRLSLAFGFAALLSALLLARFAYLQVVRHEDLQTLAEANRISVVPVVPNRGIITDRNGVVLAHNYSAYTLEIQPREIEDIDGLIDRVSTLVEIGPRDRRRFKRLMEESKRVGSLPIRTRLSDEEIARFAAHHYRFPEVEINARLFRQYPQGELLSHVVGYISRINQRELDRLEANDDAANYRGTDYIGKTGLEQRYERLLHGSTGIEEVEVDSGGRAVRTLSHTPPVSGHNLILNIDAGLQEVAYNAIGGRRGALVAIDPMTGGVLAFVSKPGFDPNLFVDGIDPLNWSELNNSPDRPLLNRALSGTYPPGSTFKPFMALAALSLGRRTPEQAIQDPGFFRFGGRVYHDGKVGGHGMVNLYKSIVESCDTYYYVLANDLGIDAISRFMGSIGFGSRTGIDIAGEAVGVLPSREWKQRRFKEKWYPGETISIGIGQGFNSYTPLQLAAAIATLANDGVMYRPHVVDYVEDSRTTTRQPIEPKPVRTLDLDPRHIAVIKQALIGVNQEGTGSRAFAKAGYVSAGKTGTVQVIALKEGEKYVESEVEERFRDHALFVAYAPADRPRIALAVVVENSGFGSRAAAPVARKVLDYYLLGRAPANAPLRINKDDSDASGG